MIANRCAAVLLVMFALAVVCAQDASAQSAGPKSAF